LTQVEAEVGNIPMVLIQNKIDLIDKAVMTPDEATALADRVGNLDCVLPRLNRRVSFCICSRTLLWLQVGLKFYKTSVKENYNIDEGAFTICDSEKLLLLG
jgi:Ras-related protein Rab-23